MEEKQRIQTFMDLNAYQEAHKLVLMVYNAAKRYPKEEIFGLTNQTRRAGVSITSNIAEGFSRGSYKDKLQFYVISPGSLTELQSQLIIGRDLNYVSREDYNMLFGQSITVHKLLNGLIKQAKVIIHNS